MNRHSKSGLKKIVSAVQRIASSFGRPNNNMSNYLHHNYHTNHLPGQDARNRQYEQHNTPFFNRRIG